MYIDETNLYIRTGTFMSGASIVPAINEAIKKQEALFTRTSIAIIHFNFCYLYFGAGMYKQALLWLNKILNEEQEFLREDVLTVVRVFYLIVHYELDNVELLDHLVRSTYDFLYKRKRLHITEKVILAFIRNKLPKVKNQKELTESFKELKTVLNKIIKDPHEANIMEFFDFVSWLESKITNVPFAEIIRKKSSVSIPLPFFLKK